MPASTDALIRQRIPLANHFPEPVTIEAQRRLGDGYELQVRRGDGTLDETILSGAEIEELLAGLQGESARVMLADPLRLRLLVESARIRLAYAHDKQFAVSLSGIRTPPHQVEAVYERMLPQPRLRFLLADDPGAGKTIMAGLYIKEMKLRQAVERALILVSASLRSERLAAVRRLGAPEESYRKITFYKEHLGQDAHVDAVLVGPGHALYAAVDEAFNEQQAILRGAAAAYVDRDATQAYRLHFLEVEIRGEGTTSDGPTTLYAEVVAVREESDGAGPTFNMVSADTLHDLDPLTNVPQAASLHSVDSQPAVDFVRAGHQLALRRTVQEERRRYTGIVRDYLTSSFEARIHAAEGRVMGLRARELAGEAEVALARQRAEQDLADLGRARGERLAGLDRLAITRPGPVRCACWRPRWCCRPKAFWLRRCRPANRTRTRSAPATWLRWGWSWRSSGRAGGSRTTSAGCTTSAASTSARSARPIPPPASAPCAASKSRAAAAASRCG